MSESKKINWGPSIFLTTYQVILLITLPFYFYYGTVQLSTVIATIILLYATGLSITAGYHRYYSHRTFKTNKIIETFLLFFGSMACQASALRWSYDHRLHHAHVDTDKDPYTITKGFLYAHCLWILDPPNKIDPKVVPDLLSNKFVMFQHKYYRSLMVLTNALACVFVGWLLNDYIGGFFLALWTRMFLLHHFTWFINSLAHTWGDKPFCQEQTAVDNYIISLLTFGEGYHNYHHSFANDYRNGIRWYHFDPTKWLLWTLHKLGLASDLKRMDATAINKKMVLERKSLLLEQIKEKWQSKKDELEKQVEELSDRMLKRIVEFSKLNKEYIAAKQEKKREIIKEMQQEIKRLKQSLRNDWRYWSALSRYILHNKGTLPKMVAAAS